MKFLLVDDDKLIRFSLKSMLTDILPNSCFFSEAADGYEMINRCNEYEPDIAFVDIRLPNLDGLSAIKVCKELSPNTSYIILTGYSNFEYAKEGIHLGVDDYIVKPVDLPSLEKVIQNHRKKASYERQLRNNRFQLKMHELFHHPAPQTIANPEYDDICNADSVLFSFTIFIDCMNNHNLYAETHNQLVSDIKAFSNQLLSKGTLYSIDYSMEGYLHITYQSSSDQGHYLKSKLEYLCSNCNKDYMHIYLYYSMHTAILEFMEALRNLDTYSNVRMDCLPCQGIDLSKLSVNQDSLLFFNMLTNLINAFQNSDEILYTKHVNEICQTFLNSPPPCNYHNLSEYVFCVTGIRPDTHSFKAFMKTFIDHSDDMYEQMDLVNNSKIDHIIDYVEHSFTSDISINQLADKFDLTPNYISKLFHERTQTKFIDYVTTLRIKYAKKLLVERADLPLKDVTLMLGYYSSRHFSSVFKKYVGVSPSDYRKQHSTE